METGNILNWLRDSGFNHAVCFHTNHIKRNTNAPVFTRCVCVGSDKMCSNEEKLTEFGFEGGKMKRAKVAETTLTATISLYFDLREMIECVAVRA